MVLVSNIRGCVSFALLFNSCCLVIASTSLKFGKFKEPYQLSEEQRNEILQHHNNLRYLASNGKLPDYNNNFYAADPKYPIKKLAYDIELEKNAENYVKFCNKRHSKKFKKNSSFESLPYSYGENIYCDSSKSVSFILSNPMASSSFSSMNANSFMNLWGQEHKNYDFGPLDSSLEQNFNGTNNENIENFCPDNQDCGHYTQIIDNRTERVGCAIAICDGIAGSDIFWEQNGGTLVVCQYWPAGNFNNLRPYWPVSVEELQVTSGSGSDLELGEAPGICDFSGSRCHEGICVTDEYNSNEYTCDCSQTGKTGHWCEKDKNSTTRTTVNSQSEKSYTCAYDTLQENKITQDWPAFFYYQGDGGEDDNFSIENSDFSGDLSKIMSFNVLETSLNWCLDYGSEICKLVVKTRVTNGNLKFLPSRKDINEFSDLSSGEGGLIVRPEICEEIVAVEDAPQEQGADNEKEEPNQESQSPLQNSSKKLEIPYLIGLVAIAGCLIL